MTLVWYAITFPIRENNFGALFWERGPVPFPTTFLMFWAISILILKWLRLKQQKATMLLDVLPNEISDEITIDSLDEFLTHINELPGASSDSFLINRVVRGIEHFRVRKSAAETVTMMESQSAIDANNLPEATNPEGVYLVASNPRIHRNSDGSQHGSGESGQ